MNRPPPDDQAQRGVVMDQKSNENSESGKVLTLAPRQLSPQEPMSTEETSFEAELRRNKELAEKMKKERQKANQAVLRSYRLKT